MAYDKRQGDFTYRIAGENVVITGYDGRADELEIPALIEEKPIMTIGKKAFLSCKSLLKVTLPETIEVMEEWAFAYCSSLQSVVLPKKKIEFGKGVFFHCNSLQEIRAVEFEEDTVERGGEVGNIQDATVEDVQNHLHPWELLGVVPVLMDAEYLLTPWEAEETHWIEKWDARMLNILNAEDGEGYSKVVLCGEEDLSASYEEFVEKKRQMKAQLAFIRLMNPYCLKAEIEQQLLTYVRTHTKNCESEAAWEIAKQHGDEKIYFEIFAETGCLSEENFDAVLEDLGQYHAEMKAYFIRYKENYMKKEDFFDSLSLDF